jgi:hypothetical protein
MRASSLLLGLALGLATSASFALAGCGGTIRAVAPTPAPKVAATPQPGATFAVMTLTAPDSICTAHEDLKDLCVDGLSAALRAGLTDVLGRFFAPARGESPTYGAEFRFQELSEKPEARQTQVSMRWQLVLSDRLGHPIVELMETTVGPVLLGEDGSPNEVVGALLNAVLERIGAAVAARKTLSTCVAGITQTCVGPNACQGTQFCVDGTHFSACECPSKP